MYHRTIDHADSAIHSQGHTPYEGLTHCHTGLTHCHTGNTPGRYLWFKNSIVTSSCHVCLKTIEGYRMLQSMYVRIHFLGSIECVVLHY